MYQNLMHEICLQIRTVRLIYGLNVTFSCASVYFGRHGVELTLSQPISAGYKS